MAKSDVLDTKIFIGALADYNTTAQLRSHFEQWGQVVDCVVMHNRGFGFVTYSDKESADRAMDQPCHAIGNKVVHVKRAMKKTRFGNDATGLIHGKIFIGGVYGDLSSGDLSDYFAQFGEVKNASLYKDAVTGESRGFAFVVFGDDSSVDQVMSVPQHIVKGVQLSVRRAQNKDSLDGSRDNSSVASGFSSDGEFSSSADQMRPRRYSTSMHPRLLNSGRASFNSLNSGVSGTSAESGTGQSIPVKQNGSACSYEDWMKGRKPLPPISAMNLKSLNEAIQAERAFNRQKIVNAEEKILELERRLIQKEKECCELKEMLLYEHQRKTMDMAQGLAPSYSCEPSTSSYMEQNYSEPTYAQANSTNYSGANLANYAEQGYSDPTFSESPYVDPTLSESPYADTTLSPYMEPTYEAAVRHGWTQCPQSSLTRCQSSLSAEAKEFTCGVSQNPKNLVSVREAGDTDGSMSSDAGDAQESSTDVGKATSELVDHQSVMIEWLNK